MPGGIENSMVCPVADDRYETCTCVDEHDVCECCGKHLMGEYFDEPDSYKGEDDE